MSIECSFDHRWSQLTTIHKISMPYAKIFSRRNNTAWKVSKYGFFSDPYFPAFGLNTKRYEASLRIQSECWKVRTRKNSVFGHFSCSLKE